MSDEIRNFIIRQVSLRPIQDAEKVNIKDLVGVVETLILYAEAKDGLEECGAAYNNDFLPVGAPIYYRSLHEQIFGVKKTKKLNDTQIMDKTNELDNKASEQQKNIAAQKTVLNPKARPSWEDFNKKFTALMGVIAKLKTQERSIFAGIAAYDGRGITRPVLEYLKALSQHFSEIERELEDKLQSKAKVSTVRIKNILKFVIEADIAGYAYETKKDKAESAKENARLLTRANLILVRDHLKLILSGLNPKTVQDRLLATRRKWIEQLQRNSFAAAASVDADKNVFELGALARLNAGVFSEENKNALGGDPDKNVNFGLGGYGAWLADWGKFQTALIPVLDYQYDGNGLLKFGAILALTSEWADVALRSGSLTHFNSDNASINYPDGTALDMGLKANLGGEVFFGNIGLDIEYSPETGLGYKTGEMEQSYTKITHGYGLGSSTRAGLFAARALVQHEIRGSRNQFFIDNGLNRNDYAGLGLDYMLPTHENRGGLVVRGSVLFPLNPEGESKDPFVKAQAEIAYRHEVAPWLTLEGGLDYSHKSYTRDRSTAEHYAGGFLRVEFDTDSLITDTVQIRGGVSVAAAGKPSFESGTTVSDTNDYNVGVQAHAGGKLYSGKRPAQSPRNLFLMRQILTSSPMDSKQTDDPTLRTFNPQLAEKTAEMAKAVKLTQVQKDFLSMIASLYYGNGMHVNELLQADTEPKKHKVKARLENEFAGKEASLKTSLEIASKALGKPVTEINQALIDDLTCYVGSKQEGDDYLCDIIDNLSHAREEDTKKTEEMAREEKPEESKTPTPEPEKKEASPLPPPPLSPEGTENPTEELDPGEE